ncbi:MAG: WbqC family protein [Bacteroidales bacterium]|nr:WbqC family protein [Candidatus Liminaster caballi]
MILPTAYLAPVSYYAALYHCPEVVIERHEHYVKQTLRNRCVIATGQGPQVLSVNVAKGNSPHTPISRLRVSNHANWMHQHLYSLATYYGNSPFYEYYIDDLKPLFPVVDGDLPLLMDMNEALRSKICELIGFNPNIRYSDEWMGRSLTDETGMIPTSSEAGHFAPVPYYQVASAESRQPFLADMSILDLLFNMGPESILVLRDSWKKE